MSQGSKVCRCLLHWHIGSYRLLDEATSWQSTCAQSGLAPQCSRCGKTFDICWNIWHCQGRNHSVCWQGAPSPKIDSHICNKAYQNVTDFSEDLQDLVATCQCHTCCSEAYCLHTRNGCQQCTFGYPKPLQHQTTIVVEEPISLIARNNGMVNNFNPVGRISLQTLFEASRMATIHSRLCKSYFINSVGERDYSAQETCHTLLQLSMFKTSHDFIVLSLDGSHAVEDNLHEAERGTVPSILDHYLVHQILDLVGVCPEVHHAKRASHSAKTDNQKGHSTTAPLILLVPTMSSTADSLMQCKSFRQITELLSVWHLCWSICSIANLHPSTFFMCNNMPVNNQTLKLDVAVINTYQKPPVKFVMQVKMIHPKWTLLGELWKCGCSYASAVVTVTVNTDDDFDWTAASQSYPNLEEALVFISRQRQEAPQQVFTTSASPDNPDTAGCLQRSPDTMRAITLHHCITGTAGTGKTYLIHCLRLLLNDKVKVAAPTRVAAFIIDGTAFYTLHS